VPAKKPRKRSQSHRPQPFAAMAPNEVWAYGFVFDGCGNGQKLKCLTLIDEFTKGHLEKPLIMSDFGKILAS
jgi:putative transposase